MPCTAPRPPRPPPAPTEGLGNSRPPASPADGRNAPGDRRQCGPSAQAARTVLMHPHDISQPAVLPGQRRRTSRIPGQPIAAPCRARTASGRRDGRDRRASLRSSSTRSPGSRQRPGWSMGVERAPIAAALARLGSRTQAPRSTRRWSASCRPGPRPDGALDRPSPREREVLAQCCGIWRAPSGASEVVPALPQLASRLHSCGSKIAIAFWSCLHSSENMEMARR